MKKCNCFIRSYTSFLHRDFLLHQLSHPLLYLVKKCLIQLLFSGSQAHILPDLVDSSIREYIYRLKPEYTDNMQFNIRLSMLIKGSFYAFYDNYHKYDNAALIDEICAFLGQCTR